nr:hypothetical protein [Tanacetum cinerariifolium]
MIAYLTKSDASEGFNQMIDFLNGSLIKYALTVNPNIYVSCIKQFWSSVSVKKVNDVTRLQAKVNKKRVIITEAIIIDALRLNDAEGIDCLPNEEIFTELARMGYEKPSTKLTFYKAFFSRCSGVETPLFEGMIVAQQVDESATKLNDDDVPAGVAVEGAAEVNVDVVPAAVDEPSTPSPTPSTQPPPPSQDIPSTSQRVNKLERRNKLKVSKLRILKKVGTTQRVNTSYDTVMDDISKQGRMIPNMDADVDVTLKDIAKDVAIYAETEESVDVQGGKQSLKHKFIKINLEHADKKTKEQIEEEDSRALKRISKSQEEKQLRSRRWMKRVNLVSGYLLSTSKINCVEVAFCLALRFALEALRFISEDLVFCLQKNLRRYPQWRSRFLRYIDTRPNGDALRKCILSCPYKPTTVLVQAVAATDNSPAIPKHTTLRKCGKLLKGYNKTRFYKLMNEMIRNNLTDATMQVNVQFLQQLQPKWLRFVTIVKQQHKLDEVSYHKLFDILKQYQKEVNELHAERLARNANPLALVATAQANQDPYYQISKHQTSKSHKSYAPSSKPSIPTRSHITTRHKDKEIAKPITPPSKTASKEDTDPEQAQMDKDIKPKRVKDSAFDKEKMLLYKQAEQGTNSEPVEQVQIDAGYNVFANELQHSEQSESVSNTFLVEMDDSNVIPDSLDMCEDDIQNDQNDVESDDERVAHANLKLDVDENKKFQKQLKKSNTTLAQELKECKTILAKTSKSLGSLLVFGIVARLHFRPSRLSFRGIRPLMTVPLPMTNLNVS